MTDSQKPVHKTGSLRGKELLHSWKNHALPKALREIKDNKETGLYVVNAPGVEGQDTLVFFDGVYFWAMKKDFAMNPSGWNPDVEVRGPINLDIPKR